MCSRENMPMFLFRLCWLILIYIASQMVPVRLVSSLPMIVKFFKGVEGPWEVDGHVSMVLLRDILWDVLERFFLILLSICGNTQCYCTWTCISHNPLSMLSFSLGLPTCSWPFFPPYSKCVCKPCLLYVFLMLSHTHLPHSITMFPLVLVSFFPFFLVFPLTCWLVCCSWYCP